MGAPIRAIWRTPAQGGSRLEAEIEIHGIGELLVLVHPLKIQADRGILAGWLIRFIGVRVADDRVVGRSPVGKCGQRHTVFDLADSAALSHFDANIHMVPPAEGIFDQAVAVPAINTNAHVAVE